MFLWHHIVLTLYDTRHWHSHSTVVQPLHVSPVCLNPFCSPVWNLWVTTVKAHFLCHLAMKSLNDNFFWYFSGIFVWHCKWHVCVAFFMTSLRCTLFWLPDMTFSVTLFYSALCNFLSWHFSVTVSMTFLHGPFCNTLRRQPPVTPFCYTFLRRLFVTRIYHACISCPSVISICDTYLWHIPITPMHDIFVTITYYTYAWHFCDTFVRHLGMVLFWDT